MNAPNDENVITADEMAQATDRDAAVTPAKFLPYRKLVRALGSVDGRLEEAAFAFGELAALFDSIFFGGDRSEDLAKLGRRHADSWQATMANARDALSAVIKSAEATVPRKRWDGSGCHDDRADDEDLAREAAAAVEKE